MTDIFLGEKRPLGFGFWPLPEDAPGVSVRREEIPVAVMRFSKHLKVDQMVQLRWPVT